MYLNCKVRDDKIIISKNDIEQYHTNIIRAKDIGPCYIIVNDDEQYSSIINNIRIFICDGEFIHMKDNDVEDITVDNFKDGTNIVINWKNNKNALKQYNSFIMKLAAL
jgi:hypothetical protein